MIIGISPFLRAMIRAALERYQADLYQKTQAEEPADNRLWINQDEKQFSLTEKPNFIGILLSAREQRTALIDSLIEKGYTISRK